MFLFVLINKSSKNVSDACKNWIESQCLSQNSTEANSDLSSPTSSTTSFGDESKIFNNITLQDLLQTTEKGQGVLDNYKQKNCLDEIHKNTLVSIIVESFSCRNKGMTMKQIQAATNAINLTFPSESKVAYFYKNLHSYVYF